MSDLSRLQSLIRSTRAMPPKIILYGQPGVGKTTFAWQAKALLMDCENGAGVFPGLVRTPYLDNWREIHGWLGELAGSFPRSECTALAVDTIDWMVRRIEQYVCQDLDPKNASICNTIAAAHGGYFKAREIIGNVVFRELLPRLNQINAQGVPIILLAHAECVKMRNPEGYDQRVAAPALPPWLLPQFTEWADAVLYASQDGNTRIVNTQMTTSVTAKNRYGMPALMKLDWSEVSAAIRATSDKATAAEAARSE